MKHTKQHNFNLQNTQVAFSYKSDKELRRSYALFLFMSWGWISRLMMRLSLFFIRFSFVEQCIKKTLFKYFTCGESLADVSIVSAQLASRGVYSILDYGLESQEDDPSLDSACASFLAAVESKKHNQHITHISMKVTALFPNDVLVAYSQYLLPRLFEQKSLPLDPSGIKDERWCLGMKRVYKICLAGKANKVCILFDAEESWVQAAIDYIALRMMREFNTRETCIIYNTYQMYRVDAMSLLSKSYELMQHQPGTLGVKLVRGAYMEKERHHASINKIPSLIHPTKEATDACFNEGLLFCMERIPRIHCMVATHNEESTHLAVKTMCSQRGTLSCNNVSFAQLYGMGDHLTYNLQQSGAVVAKYMPYGKVRQVFNYLMRRARENSSLQGHSSRELTLIRHELRRRKRVKNK